MRGKLRNARPRSRSADGGKVAKLTVIWEHQPTDDANTRVERAFAMLLRDELDALSNDHTAECHNKDKSVENSDSNPQVGGNK